MITPTSRREFFRLCGAGFATAALPGRRPGFTLTDVTAAAGIQFRHNNGGYGGKLLPETHGIRMRVHRLRRRRLAGHPARQRHGLARPSARQPSANDAAALQEQPERHVHRCHARGRTRRRVVRHGRRRRRLQQRRISGHPDHVRRPEPAVPQHRQGHVRRRDPDERTRRTDRLQHVGACGSTSIATACSISSSATTCEWTPEHDVFCSLDGRNKSYCTPEAYRGDTCWLFRNRGDGTFEDVTARCGIFDSSSKSLGVTLIDSDIDGWPDLFVANDTQPNKLYRNLHNGTFKDVAVAAGLAFSTEGKARAGMGVDAADFENSGVPGLAVTNFDNEMIGLYRSAGRGLFEDVAVKAGVGGASRNSLGFGCLFADFEPGRIPRSRRGQRSHRRDRPQHSRQRRLRTAAASLSQPGRRDLQGRGRRGRTRLCAATRRPWPRVRPTSIATATSIC